MLRAHQTKSKGLNTLTEHIKDLLNDSELSTKKEAKKTKDKALSLKTLSLKERKGFRVAHQMPIDNSKREQEAEANSQQGSEARIRSRKNAEIDEYLLQLLMDGLIDEAYWKFHTKCVHTLSLTKYNQLVIEARAGRIPKNLLAFKLKGAMELHFKKKLYREQRGIK